MLSILAILLSIYQVSSLQIADQPQTESEDQGTTSSINLRCREDGIFCFDNHEILCENGLQQKIMPCSGDKICIDNIGCVSNYSLEINDIYNYASFKGDFIDNLACVTGTLDCLHEIVIFCSNGTWEEIFNCSQARQTCVSGKCGGTTIPTTTSTPTTTTTTTSRPTTTTKPTTTTTTTNAPCVDGKLVCKGDSIFYCKDNAPIEVVDCSNNEMTCENGKCTVPTKCNSEQSSCDGNKVMICNKGVWVEVIDCTEYGLSCNSGTCQACQTKRGIVLSIYSDIRVPNLDDRSCTSYYECNMNVSKTGNFTCNMKNCTSGLVFDPCSGFCTSSATCDQPSPCETLKCPTSRPQQILTSNNKLAYTCTANGQTVNTVWKACPLQIFDENSGVCTSGTNTCHNGEQDDGTCKEPGKKPVPGTNCSFRLCSNNLAYTDVKCLENYHYDDSQKGCVIGQCTNMK